MTEFTPVQIAQATVIGQRHGLRRVAKGSALEAKGWQAWLKTLAPNSFNAPFSKEHIEFWDLYWDILHRQKAGEVIPAKERSLLLFLGRGMGKSTHAEMAAIAEGCILGEGFALYLSDSQMLAEEHLYSVKAILENGIFADYYPLMASPVFETDGRSKSSKYTQDTIITNNGKWAMTARGLMGNVRGGRVGALRFTLVLMDDADSLTDSLMVIEKKKRIISRSVVPAMAKSGKVIFAQNPITKNSMASQILNRKSDIFSDRTIIGGGAIKSFKDLEIEQIFEADGTPRWQMTKATPTWEYFNLEDAKSFLAMSGKEAFLAEYQHEFDEKRGKVIPNYNEDAQVITWSMFEKVIGSRFIPRHWHAACGLDVGFSDGMHPHYSYWGFMAAASENAPKKLAGAQFLYRGRGFIGTAIDDQALEIWEDMLRDGDYFTNFKSVPALEKQLTIPENYPHEQGGSIRQWQMSHEATGVMLTLRSRYALPFNKLTDFKATDGVAQWNNMSRCDYTQPNPFKEDEQLADGTYLIGRPMLYYIVDDTQYTNPIDERGLKLFRRQAPNWEYVQTKITEAGLTEEKPSKIDEDSCDVVKGLTQWFGQPAAGLTTSEKIEAAMPVNLQPAVINAMTDMAAKDNAIQAALKEREKLTKQMSAPIRGAALQRFRRR